MATMRIELEINHRSAVIDIRPGETLLWPLRRHGYWSVKYGCDSGDCGACMVLLDGEPCLSCILPAQRAAGRRLVTVEALGHPEALHPLQSEFLSRGAVQCGYCTPAMLLVAHAVLQREPGAGSDAIREALSSVLCRCTGYVKPVEAIEAVARGLAAAARGPAPEPAPAPGHGTPAAARPVAGSAPARKEVDA
jgi:putative selenate reductase molybdopterin-binding subunit